MGHWFYITPEEYAAAEEVGIAPGMLDRRIREQGWSKEKAMTTPPRKGTDRRHWAAIAEKNGINYAAFMSRVYRGWSMELAATKSLESPEEAKLHALKATEHMRKLPSEYLRLAEKNGIPYATFHTRVRSHGWNLERAATEPVWTREQIGRLGAQRRREREGDWAAIIFGRR